MAEIPDEILKNWITERKPTSHSSADLRLYEAAMAALPQVQWTTVGPVQVCVPLDVSNSRYIVRHAGRYDAPQYEVFNSSGTVLSRYARSDEAEARLVRGA